MLQMTHHKNFTNFIMVGLICYNYTDYTHKRKDLAILFAFKGTLSARASPSLKTVPRTVFKFTPCRGLVYRGVSLTAVSDQRLCLMESASLCKGLSETLNDKSFQLRV